MIQDSHHPVKRKRALLESNPPGITGSVCDGMSSGEARSNLASQPCFSLFQTIYSRAYPIPKKTHFQIGRLNNFEPAKFHFTLNQHTPVTADMIRHHRERIEVEQEHFLLDTQLLLGKSSEELRPLKFLNLLNAIALNVSASEAIQIAENVDLKSVSPSRERNVLLDDSVSLIGAHDAWSYLGGYTGKGVKIAVLDTGVYVNHPDFEGKHIPERCYCYDCLGVCGPMRTYESAGEGTAVDVYGHGTNVASIVGGNGVLKGVAPDAELYAYKITTNGGRSSSTNMIAALEHAIDPNGDGDFSDSLDIATISLGGPGDPDDPESLGVDEAVENGLIVVVAAGNSGPELEDYCRHSLGDMSICSPGTARKAITVGGTTKSDTLMGMSSRGPVVNGDEFIMKPDMVAPGEDICSAASPVDDFPPRCVDEHHRDGSGTSFAAPHVTGAAALLLEKNPDWTPQQIKDALMYTAKDIGYSQSEMGAGRVDISEAITLDQALSHYCPYCRESSVITNGENEIVTGHLRFVCRVYVTQWEYYGEQDGGLLEIEPGETIDLSTLFGHVQIDAPGHYQLIAEFWDGVGLHVSDWEFVVRD